MYTHPSGPGKDIKIGCAIGAHESEERPMTNITTILIAVFTALIQAALAGRSILPPTPTPPPITITATPVEVTTTPTAIPTVPPTVVPTTVPTAVPTIVPTATPTNTPTNPPTTPTAALTPKATDIPSAPTYTPTELDLAVLDAINEIRRSEGVRELTLEARYLGVTYVRAQEISVKWSHTRPNGGRGLNVFDEYGVRTGGHRGEILGRGYGVGASEVVSAWVASESHHREMLMPDFTKVGIASYIGTDGRTYIAVLFSNG